MSLPDQKSTKDVPVKFLKPDEVRMLEKEVIKQLDCAENKETFDRVVVRIQLKSGTLLALKGEARHKWMHEIRRNDIKDRRVCSTFRELSSEFVSGERQELGKTLLEIASGYNGTVVI